MFSFDLLRLLLTIVVVVVVAGEGRVCLSVLWCLELFFFWFSCGGKFLTAEDEIALLFVCFSQLCVVVTA